MAKNLDSEIVAHLRRLLPQPRAQLTTHQGELVDEFVRHLDAVVSVWHHGSIDGTARRMIEMRFSDGATVREIARDMGYSDRWVRGRIREILLAAAAAMPVECKRDMLTRAAYITRDRAGLWRFGVPCLRKGAKGDICWCETWYRDPQGAYQPWVDNSGGDWVCQQCGNRVPVGV